MLTRRNPPSGRVVNRLCLAGSCLRRSLASPFFSTTLNVNLSRLVYTAPAEQLALDLHALQDARRDRRVEAEEEVGTHFHQSARNRFESTIIFYHVLPFIRPLPADEGQLHQSGQNYGRKQDVCWTPRIQNQGTHGGYCNVCFLETLLQVPVSSRVVRRRVLTFFFPKWTHMYKF